MMTMHLDITHFPTPKRVPRGRDECVGAVQVLAKVSRDTGDKIEEVREHHCLSFEGRGGGSNHGQIDVALEMTSRKRRASVAGGAAVCLSSTITDLELRGKHLSQVFP